MSIEEEQDFEAATTDLIRNKILHVLKIYPRISMSMLQVGIGTAISPKMWHPIFDSLKKEGKIDEKTVAAQGPSGRDQSHTIISLSTAFLDNEFARKE